MVDRRDILNRFAASAGARPFPPQPFEPVAIARDVPHRAASPLFI